MVAFKAVAGCTRIASSAFRSVGALSALTTRGVHIVERNAADAKSIILTVAGIAFFLGTSRNALPLAVRKVSLFAGRAKAGIICRTGQAPVVITEVAIETFRN